MAEENRRAVELNDGSLSWCDQRQLFGVSCYSWNWFNSTAVWLTVDEL
jgi:hypothetical protein